MVCALHHFVHPLQTGGMMKMLRNQKADNSTAKAVILTVTTLDDWCHRVHMHHSPIELRLLLQASLGDSQQVLLQLADPVRGLSQPPPHLLPLLRQALRWAQQLLWDREAAVGPGDSRDSQSQPLNKRAELQRGERVLDRIRSLCNTHDLSQMGRFNGMWDVHICIFISCFTHTVFITWPPQLNQSRLLLQQL